MTRDEAKARTYRAAGEEQLVTLANEMRHLMLMRPGDRRAPLRFLRAIGERIGPDDVDAARVLLADPASRELDADVPGRLRAIVHAAEHGTAELRGREKRAGVAAVRRRLDQLIRARRKICAASARVPGTTGAGVLAKLAIATHDVGTHIDEFADETQVEFVLAIAVCDAFAVTLAPFRRPARRPRAPRVHPERLWPGRAMSAPISRESVAAARIVLELGAPRLLGAIAADIFDALARGRAKADGRRNTVVTRMKISEDRRAMKVSRSK